MGILIKRHLIHWMAILAILIGALAPSISQAIAVADTGKGILRDPRGAGGVSSTAIPAST